MRGPGLHLSEDAEHALTELARRHAGPIPIGAGGGGAFERTDGGLSGDTGGIFFMDAEYDVARPPSKPRWHGTIDVDGPAGEPVFLLLGERTHLPSELRELAASAPGGASLPLTLDSWRTIQAHLRAFTSAGARRCVAALEQGRPAPAAVLELSDLPGQDPTFALAPGHDHSAPQAFAAASRRNRRRTAARRRSLRADPFCVRELDALPAALRRLDRARCAGRSCSESARSTPTPPGSSRSRLRPTRRSEVAGPGRRAEAVPARGRGIPAAPAPRVPCRRAGPRQDDRGACRRSRPTAPTPPSSSARPA